MKTFVLTLLLLIAAVNSWAAPSAKAAGAGLLVWLFVGFVALFIVSQLIPALIQCGSLLRELLQKKHAV
ncbi:MAG: hypothetical protein JXR59_09605 [Desulfuromonadaceae bacterium]|nr:hypothetical protein [Desulfuromonadaceae bacterium]